MRAEVVDELEEFVRRGRLWNEDELTALIGRLEAEWRDAGDAIAHLLCAPLQSLLVRMRLAEVPPSVRVELEAVLYPRLWKVMEAARDDLPEAELRTRVEVLNRRLSRIFAEE